MTIPLIVRSRVTIRETRPAEYTQQLIRILGANPTMTISDLAKKLAKSPKWLTDRLSIAKLDEKIQILVNENKVNLTNAYALAKLKDFSEQMNFLDRAITETPQVFVQLITNRVKELNEARRKGQDKSPEGFIPIAHLHKTKELEAEIASKSTAQVFKGKGRITNVDDFVMGVMWACHLDPDSVEEAKTTWEKRKKDKEEEKKKSKMEKAKKQKDEADKILAEMQNPNGQGAGATTATTAS